jgi:methylated-DNA-[protein]-cysteine S-methyltransferase
MRYQARLPVPFGMLGIRCSETALLGIDFLAPAETDREPDSRFARTVCKQLLAYLEDPDFQFTLRLELQGTPYQKMVWKALTMIPRGKTLTYGQLALRLNSGAQAIGQVCGANPIPIIVPCHRVVGKAGIGGFMRHASGSSLDIKRWLLAHEQD